MENEGHLCLPFGPVPINKRQFNKFSEAILTREIYEKGIKLYQTVYKKQILHRYRV